MASVVDYVGRTVDLSAFQDARAGANVKLSQRLANPGEQGEAVTGILKLAQRWLVEFLTIRGSIRALPGRGSRFMSDLRSGSLRTTLDAEQAFNLAAKQVRQNLQREETEDTPEDEAIASTTLERLTISGDTLIIDVTLTSQAGESYTLIMPIGITPA